MEWKLFGILDREMQVELEMNAEGVSGLLQRTPGGIKNVIVNIGVKSYGWG